MHEKHEGKDLYMSDYMQTLYYNVMFVLHKTYKKIPAYLRYAKSERKLN